MAGRSLPEAGRANLTPVPTDRRPKARGWLLALVALAVLVVAVPQFRGRGTLVRSAEVSRTNLRVFVSCSGELRPPLEGEVRAREPGIVAAIETTEGATVRAGQPLLRVSSPELALATLQAREELLRLEAERGALAAEREQAGRELERRRRTLQADTRLLAAGAIRGAAEEASAAALHEAEQRLAALQARWSALEGAGDVTSQIALSRARVRSLEARLSALLLRAPIDGVVFGLPQGVGEAIAAGQRAASVARPDRPRLVVHVDEPDAPRVAVGQAVVVAFDGLPERRFEGALTRLERSVRRNEGRDVVDAEAEIADPDHRLPLNGSVSVEIVLGESANAVVAPRGALLRDAEERYVLVVRDGRAQRQPVSVGLIGLSEVQVLTGLAPGDTVILPGANAIAPGERVSLDGR